jgi:DNA repair protein RecN (Recombination protein N)
VVTGLGLLFGGRAGPARVRPGAQRAIVEGRLRTAPDGPVARQVEEAGGGLDEDGTLVLSRTVSAEGRSRAFAGGCSVPVSLLTYLADDLVAVHGQADQQQLLKPGRQREALDRYAGAELAEVFVGYQRAFGRHRTVHAELATLTSQARSRAAEAEALRVGLTEIEKVEPVAGEEAALRAEEERLANADGLHAAATTAHEALLGDPTVGHDGADAVTLLGHARQALDAVRRHDAVIDDVAGRLSEAVYLVSDLAGELASYIQAIDADPARLAAVQERRAALGRLIRAYGPGGIASHINGPAAAPAAEPAEAAEEFDDVAAVLDWARRAAARVAELDTDDDKIAGLIVEEAELAGQVAALATRLSELRREAGKRFSDDVTTELTALAMPHARISVALSELSEPGPHGIDEVEIRLAAHPGAPALPLHKGASGGELSRVMLAIEVVFAGADPVPTFVFDEVDAGVGGKAAVEVARRLARLARLAQVIVVTHLPQVAAFADTHLMVAKSSDGTITRSGVIHLDYDGRIRELSRMLAGLEDSEFGQAHAAELLAMAAEQAARS